MAQNALRKNKNKLLMLLAVSVMTLGYTMSSHAQYLDQGGVAPLISKIITQNDTGAGGTTAGVIKISYFNRGAVEAFYEGREFAPLWVTNRGDAERAEEVLALFDASWTHGLNPENYHVGEIRGLIGSDSKADKARLELLVTDAAIRYGRDLTGMRIDPRAIQQKAEYWRKALSSEEVLEKLAASASPVRALREMEPATPLYKALQKELVRLGDAQNGYEHVLPLKFGGNTHFTPGSRHKDVAGLRVRLGIAHDPALGAESFYDDETAAAVMRLQREHGLHADAIIGPQTLAILNQSNRARMEQVVANLERLRWLEQDRPERYLLVNIPQQLVWAVEDGKVAFESRVVVGMPWRRTKDFKTEVQGVRFNPNWTVPMGIKMADFLPKLKEDPNYLTEKGIEVIKGYGSEAETLDPTAIDWHSVDRREMNAMRFVQRPGDHNALGAVRVLMQNDYDIYMHDTNHPEFFEKDQRTYSSGCIRLSEPEKVANFVLQDNDDWSQEKMDALIADGKTVEVYAEKKFPVYIIYQSMWLDDSGRLVYGADVYKRDQELIEVLAKMDGYSLPAADSRVAEAGEGAESALALNN